jgi:histone H3/H4
MKPQSFQKTGSGLNIPQLLKEQNAAASESAGTVLTNFATQYARRLVRRCMEVAKVKGRLTESDIQYVYEAEKGIRSPIMEAEQIDRRLKTIEAINKNALKDLEYVSSDDPSHTPPLAYIQTVRIGNQTYSGFPSGQNFQLCFEHLKS